MQPPIFRAFPDPCETNSLPIVRPKAGERTPPIKTQARSAVILPNFVGLKFMIHNGKNYNEVTITEDMVGYKLGEFAAYVHITLAGTSENITDRWTPYTERGRGSRTSRPRTNKIFEIPLGRYTVFGIFHIGFMGGVTSSIAPHQRTSHVSFLRTQSELDLLREPPTY